MHNKSSIDSRSINLYNTQNLKTTISSLLETQEQSMEYNIHNQTIKQLTKTRK